MTNIYYLLPFNISVVSATEGTYINVQLPLSEASHGGVEGNNDDGMYTTLSVGR